MVRSYVHLRREGLEGYVSDFNILTKAVWNISSNVEVLPVVPFVFPGLDDLGGKLVSRLKDWIKWISDIRGQEEIRYLAETGGREEEGEGTQWIYPPSFNGQPKECHTSWRNQGGGRAGQGKVNLEYTRGERREITVRKAVPTREIGNKLAETGAEEEEMDDDREMRESFENGISVEAEYSFARAVSEYSKAAVREGRHRGGYILNIKEQVSQRTKLESEKSRRTEIVFISSSQVERIAKEVKKVGSEVLDVTGIVSMNGVLNGDEVERVLEECRGMECYPKKVVIGGPGNSLVRHGEPGKREMKPERRIVIEKSSEGGDSLSTRYHLTEPVRIKRDERLEVIRQTVRLAIGISDMWPGTEIEYLGLYPRHVERCCLDRTHMTDEDVLTMCSNRRELNKDITDEMTDAVEKTRHIPWYVQLGYDEDMAAGEVKTKNIVQTDGIHLTPKANRFAAVFLCRRLAIGELISWGGPEKRLRMMDNT